MRGTSTLDAERVQKNIEDLAAAWAGERAERQRRRHLDPADFDRLSRAGFQHACLPVEYGGFWESHEHSSRSVFELLRTLAHGDSSVALVAAMHPAVLAAGFWLGNPQARPPFEETWDTQRHAVFQIAREGGWWGTIMSESGSGGDTTLTRAVARRDPDAGDGDSLWYRITGQKQFGSGSGITSYVITTAIPEGESEPDIFFIDMRGLLDSRGVPVDGAAGVTLTAAWDGHGMTSTQSHALAFADMPATRVAWPSYSRKGAIAVRASGGPFASVIVGIVEVAVEKARRQVRARRESLRPYEQVEWSRVELEAWLIQQAYIGVLSAAEAGGPAVRGGLLGKTAIAELAESVLTRICRVVGGSAFSRHSPYGYWLEDVRALGFLRPPWPLAFDRLIADALS